MAEEEIDFYKDISDLKKDLEGLRAKKDVSTKDLHDAVQRLATTITEMLEVFAAAAEQMQLEERDNEYQSKKQDAMISKLDKLIDQNKTIAEGMVAIVDLVKEKLVYMEKEEEPVPQPKEEPMFRPAPQPFTPRQEWQPMPEPIMSRATMAPPIAPMPSMPNPMAAPPPSPMPPPMPDFGMEMPPMEPEPLPELDFPGPELEGTKEESRKKGLFGMFKK